jgi:hypothetical protein
MWRRSRMGEQAMRITVLGAIAIIAIVIITVLTVETLAGKRDLDSQQGESQVD